LPALENPAVFLLVLPASWPSACTPACFTPCRQSDNGDIAYPMLIVNLLPSGLVGLMIAAALLAALMEP